MSFTDRFWSKLKVFTHNLDALMCFIQLSLEPGFYVPFKLLQLEQLHRPTQRAYQKKQQIYLIDRAKLEYGIGNRKTHKEVRLSYS